jgi:hypothetical protein
MFELSLHGIAKQIFRTISFRTNLWYDKVARSQLATEKGRRELERRKKVDRIDL